MPPGCLTEGTLERGHQHKMCKNQFSRNNLFKSENQDILDRTSWYTDPVLLWEHYVGQVLKVGKLRPRKSSKSNDSEVLQVALEVPEDELE